MHRRGASRGYLVTHGCRFRFSSVLGGRAALVSSWLSTWSSCGSVFLLVALSSGLDSSASSGASMDDGYWPVTEKTWTCCSPAHGYDGFALNCTRHHSVELDCEPVSIAGKGSTVTSGSVTS